MEWVECSYVADFVRSSDQPCTEPPQSKQFEETLLLNVGQICQIPASLRIQNGSITVPAIETCCVL
eukprot:scaffold2510_cov169-Amphora_coffeaeformis.AAC.30